MNDRADGAPETYDIVVRRVHVIDGQNALAGVYDVGVRGGDADGSSWRSMTLTFTAF